MKKISNWNIHLKISFYSLIFTLVAFFISFFCFFNGYTRIPLGFALGGGLASFVYFLHYLADIQDAKKGDTIWAIVVLISRMILFIALLVVVAFLQFKMNLNIFDIFSYCGGYLISVVVHVVVLLVDKEKKKDGNI